MQNIVLVVSAVIVIVLIFKIFSLPIRLLFKIALNTLGGFIALFLFNLLSAITGIYIEPNLINSLIVGIFGLPGFGLLLAVRWILMR